MFAVLATLISAIGVYKQFFEPGELKMTPPSVIYLGNIGSREPSDYNRATIYFRALLYSTAKRGHRLQTVYVELSRENVTYDF